MAMIIPRHFKPSKGGILWHYCSPQIFQSIVSNKALRFADINSMNDGTEVRWGYNKFIKAINNVSNKIDRAYAEDLDKHFSSLQFTHLPLAACFSEARDLLSQWRAYAADGVGYAIGFDSEMLAALPVRGLSVCYDENSQEREIEVFLVAYYEDWKSDERRVSKEALFSVVSSFVDTRAYKNPSFFEESEVRLIHLVGVQCDGQHFRLESTGGTRFGEEWQGPNVQFMQSNGLLRPFVDISFSGSKYPAPIREIILGPKNPNLPTTVDMFVTSAGLTGYDVTKSKSPYR